MHQPVIAACLAVAIALAPGTGEAATSRIVTRGSFSVDFRDPSDALDQTVADRMIETYFAVYPQLAADFNPATLRRVTFRVDPAYGGPAEADNGVVTYGATWFKAVPGDIDVVTHEVMHIVQSYTGEGPGWLTEGIADFVRNKYGVDNAGAGWSLPAFHPSQSYNNSYRITARFLEWLDRNGRPKLVTALDAQLRAGTYSAASWCALAGKDVDALWADYATASAPGTKVQRRPSTCPKRRG